MRFAKMILAAVIGVTGIGASAGCGTPTHASVGVYASSPGYTARTRPGHVWVDGYYDYDSWGNQVWVEGYWAPHRTGYTYYPGSYVVVEGRRVYRPSYWRGSGGRVVYERNYRSTPRVYREARPVQRQRVIIRDRDNRQRVIIRDGRRRY